MPTISLQRDDLEALIAGYGEPSSRIPLDQLEQWLMLVKGELKGHNAETGELRIELQDSNRPDLWCCEGIARQIRIKQRGAPLNYPFFKKPKRTAGTVIVAPGMEEVRPYIAACAVAGYRVTAAGLAQLIQTQEKLADIFGRKRRTVSIGLYRLARIEFPVTYDLVKPDEIRFTPLGMETVMTLREILMVHPKGVEYGGIVGGHDRLPVLRDATGQVLSFPPIINSREVGEVQVGDDQLFVEVTGTDLPMVTLALNIFAANLADRGALITPVEIHAPVKTVFGKRWSTPLDFGQPRTIPLAAIESALGEAMGAKDVSASLKSYGYGVKSAGKQVTVQVPPYRHDLLHTVDVVEDVAISEGYARFAPVMPSQFTVGGLSRVEQMADRVRHLMVGMEFQEIISNIMGSRQDFCSRMRLEGTAWSKVVEVDNVMSLSYSCLRQWVVPSLLQVEANSSRAFYPHRMFEVGEVAVPDAQSEIGSRTVTALGAVIAHAGAAFSEIHSCLDLLMYYLDRSFTLEPVEHPSFLDGRAGKIVSGGRAIGLLGEVHPEVLEQWQIGVPVVALELEIDQLLESL
ncbi:MAG: phenylalanine--tRNA ligase subunit beta [Nitrospira sp.]|nr:MAG: phenylalanine--tRNA ligase subunit beta [Nitrospira sp.]